MLASVDSVRPHWSSTLAALERLGPVMLATVERVGPESSFLQAVGDGLGQERVGLELL